MAQKTFCILFSIFLLATALHAQNSNNYLQVISNTSLNWTIDTQTEMESEQPISGAITLRLKHRSNPSPRSLNARVSTFITPSGFSAPFIPLKIDYTSDNSPRDANLIVSPLTLTATNQRLFSHTKHSANKIYNFYYDLILTETVWDFPPGNYNYTITFSFDYP